MFRRILRFDEPLTIPDGWSTKNEVEFATKVIKDHCRLWDYNCQDTYEKWTNIKMKWKSFVCESSLFPNGKYTAVVVGNSHALCSSGAVHLNPLFKTVLTAAAPGINIPPQKDSNKDVTQYTAALLDIIKNFKPDVVFFISRYLGQEFFTPIRGPIEEDNAFIEMDKMLKYISQYTKSIIMNLPDFRYQVKVAAEYARMKKINKGVDFSILRKSIRKASAPINQAYERMEDIDCPKCIFWDYQEALCDKNYCNPIDPDVGLPLVRDFDHVTLLGVRKVLDKGYYSVALPGKIFDYYDVAKGNIPSSLNFGEKVPETFFEDEEPVKVEEPEDFNSVIEKEEPTEVAPAEDPKSVGEYDDYVEDDHDKLLEVSGDVNINERAIENQDNGNSTDIISNVDDEMTIATIKPSCT